MDTKSIFAKAMSLSETSHLGQLEVFVGTLAHSEKEAVAAYCEDYCDRFESESDEAPTVLKAMRGTLVFTKPKGLPPAIDKCSDQSTFVLVSFGDDDSVMKCCYSHDLDGWVDASANYYAKSDAFEWWPIPAKGSGTSPE